jgi:hypothetical protein
MVYEVRIELDESKSMLEQEQAIQEAVNAVGREATRDALKSFDVSGEPLLVGGVKHTRRATQTEQYECPYGRITVAREVYQTSKGGRVFCPMESAARIIAGATPKFAKTLSYKYGNGGGRAVVKDLAETTGREICPAFVQTVCEVVGAGAEFYGEKDIYRLPEDMGEPVQISFSLDGTCMLMCEDGWREAMAGTISFFDRDGERLHTIYIGAAPEHGKTEFLTRFEREIKRVKALYPGCVCIGLADGAAANWEFLGRWADKSILDFYHAAEYVKLAAAAMFPGAKKQQSKEKWLSEALHNLKRKPGAARGLLEEFTAFLPKASRGYRADMETVVTYFSNHHEKMKYSWQTRHNMPIGSGVIEAACKELIKQRMANSGMRWKERGAGMVIAIRSLILSPQRWGQFWDKIAGAGCPEHKNFSKIK